MSKHTPAPWATLLHSCAPEKIFSIGPIEAYFEMVDGEILPFLDVPEEDARLIAAAPDMYDALKALVQELSENDEDGLIEHTCQMINARAVIAKIAKVEGRNE